MAFLFIIYYTFIELFFEFCHIFINFACKTIIKVMTKLLSDRRER